MFQDTSAKNAARVITDWVAALGAPNGLMSDGPTHFKNNTVRLVAKGLKVPHHFTLPYSLEATAPLNGWEKSSFKLFGRSRPSYKCVQKNGCIFFRSFKAHSTMPLLRNVVTFLLLRHLPGWPLLCPSLLSSGRSHPVRCPVIT